MWRTFFLLGYRIAAKVYDNPSRFGIEGFGRISKLEVYRKGTQLLNYDRGWDFNHLSEPVTKAICRFVEWMS